MSDSSEDEDLSRFKDVVDNSFMQSVNLPDNDQLAKANAVSNLKSDRYLEESSHYNDVRVPAEMQKRIGAKISALIEKKIKFVNVESKEIDQDQGIEGGVKLFRTSAGFLSPLEAEDTYTAGHNAEAKRLGKKRRKNIEENETLDENEKVNAVTVSGDYVLSKEETKFWKSRRKEKVFKYKSNKNSKVLSAVL